MATPWPWYHGQLSRLKAEEELFRAGQDGSFLVRDSESMKGAYALCVLHQGKIHQYRIMPSRDETGEGFIIKAVQGVQQQKYVYLHDLIKGYGHSNNGLACGLTHPVSVKTNNDEDEDPDTEDEEKSTREAHSLLADSVKLFQHRYTQLNLGRLDDAFAEQLQGYICNELIKDIESVQSGSSNTPYLQNLLSKSTREFQKQLDLFMAKIKVINQLFDQDAIVRSEDPDLEPSRSTNLNSFLDKLPGCKDKVRRLQKQVLRSLQDVCKSYDISQEEDDEPTSPERKSYALSNRMSQIPPVTFEVKAEGFKPIRMKLVIDMASAHLQIMKITRDSRDDNTTYVYSHDKILQLIKSRTNNVKLSIKVDGSKRKDFTFDTAKERETFCQLIQQMKNIHSHSSDIDQISVFIGTWNMGDTIPTGPLQRWIQSEGTGKTLAPELQIMPHDLYVIGTQESALSERDWVNRIKKELLNSFNIDFKTVAICTLWQIRLVILVKPEHIHRISHVEQSTVKTGIANALGNKGAVAISFNFNGTSLCFINCHLTSGNEKCSRRNQNYFDILKGLQLGVKEPYNVTNAFHQLFWFGDLNYRLESDIQGILRLICENKFEALVEMDQLTKEQKLEKAFAQFKEENICFPPTYRYRRGSSKEYVWEKVKKTGVRINVPSFCDRVLWKSYPEVYISNTSYGCTTDILTSDHHPVFATFNIGIITQFVSYKQNIPQELGDSSQSVHIIFTEVEATVKTKTNNNKYCLEFQSSCFEKKTQSSGNRLWSFDNSGLHDFMSSPKWTNKELTPLIPIVSDYAYLEDQYVLVAVKSGDSDEYYGECVIALKSKFGSMPSSFKGLLSHQGEITGEIRGQMHVKTDDQLLNSLTLSRKGRTYELVSFDEGSSSHQSQEFTFLPNTNDRSLSPKLPLRQRSQQTVADDVPTPPARRRHNLKQIKSMYEDIPETIGDIGTNEKIQARTVPDVYEVTGAPPVDITQLTGRLSPYNRQISEPVTPQSKPPLPLRLAATHNNQSYSEMVEDDDEDDNSCFEYPPGPPLPQKQPNRALSPAPGMRVLPPLPPRPSSQNTQKTDQPPPLPPLPRDVATKNNMPDYEALSKPKTISEWLMNLGLPNYVTNLMDCGWDSLEFIDTISDVDLMEAGITNVEHKRRILKSISEMQNQS